MHLKMRVTREITLWALFAQELLLAGKDPFVYASHHTQTWRGDRDLWRLFFNHVKPKERMINLWNNEDLWLKSQGLVEGVLRHQNALDALITQSSLHWKLYRMSGVDRNILRLATYELAFKEKIPPRAILNEAIELGKRYGTNDSGRFINGVLDRIAHDLKRVPKKSGRYRGPRVEVLEVRSTKKKLTREESVPEKVHTDELSALKEKE
jgi:transcription antitermination factor NusB